MSDGIKRLAREACNANAETRSLLITRMYHPTYGTTKAEIRRSLNRTQTLIEAYMIASGIWDKPAMPLLTDVIKFAPTLGLDLESLRADIQEHIGRG